MTFITLDTRLPPYRHALYAWVPPRHVCAAEGVGFLGYFSLLTYFYLRTRHSNHPTPTCTHQFTRRVQKQSPNPSFRRLRIIIIHRHT